MDMFCYLAKITFIGDSRSGKTTLIKRYQENLFEKDVYTTIGVDYSIKEIPKTDSQPNSIKLQIWDTAGQERFNSIVRLYFRNSYAIVIVFDLSNKQSLEHVPNWLDMVRQEYDPEMFIIVGNKSDILTSTITRQEVHKLLASITPTLDYTYIETSAKNNINIKKIFRTVIEHINTNIDTYPSLLKNELALQKVNKLPISYKIGNAKLSNSIKPKCCSIS